MKEWVAPELLELSAEWTQNTVNTGGSDSYGESGLIPGFGEVSLGSGCC